MKLLQEIRGFAEVTQRRPQPRKPGLFLIQLRSHVSQTTGVKRKQTITVSMHDQPDIPHPVKITHVRPASIQPPAPVHVATVAVTAP